VLGKGGVGERAEIVHHLEYGKGVSKISDFLDEKIDECTALIHQIRKYAIHRLSTDFVLSPIEKINLARVHKVSAWMEEGVTSLVNSDAKPTLHDLSTLGWETAAQILWIRDNLPGNTLRFRRDGIKCGYCPSSDSLINSNWNCCSCHQAVPADAQLTATGPGTISGLTDRIFPFRMIQCGHPNCRGVVFSSIAIYCDDCSAYLSANHNIRITPMKQGKELIEEMFGEEIKNCEVT
jgi:hypothetical protein